MPPHRREVALRAARHRPDARLLVRPRDRQQVSLQVGEEPGGRRTHHVRYRRGCLGPERLLRGKSPDRHRDQPVGRDIPRKVPGQLSDRLPHPDLSRKPPFGPRQLVTASQRVEEPA